MFYSFDIRLQKTIGYLFAIPPTVLIFSIVVSLLRAVLYVKYQLITTLIMLMEAELKKQPVCVYPFEWLDALIGITLNPAKAAIHTITSEEAGRIITHINEELEYDRLPTIIKSQAFALQNNHEVSVLIMQYHAALVAHLDQALENQKASPSKNAYLKDIYKVLLNYLSASLSFLETRFSKFISLEERVSVIYLSVTQKELRKRLDQLKGSVAQQKEDEPFYELILKRLYYFTDKTFPHHEVTFRDIFYKKELVKGFEHIQNEPAKTDAYSALDELLIYLNFNSKLYINRLTNKLAQKINECERIVDKMDKLLYYYKAFNQLHHKPGVVLNPNYHDLEKVLGNWFEQEVLYLEKKMQLPVMPPPDHAEPSRIKEQPPKEKQKVMCVLSSDQTALILRAADELRLLISKSMSEVFKTIVPHLSTPHKAELSFDGMRSKSYAPEEKDKQKAIEALERVIKKIKEY